MRGLSKRTYNCGCLIAALLIAICLGACGGDEAATETSGTLSDPPAPGFNDTSGQTDIPAFGNEAGSGPREEVEAVLNAYLAATRKAQLDKACSYLHASTRAQLLEFSASGGRVSAGCAERLRFASRVLTRGREPYRGEADVASLRIKGPGAFALFHGEDGVDYWVAMKLEGKQWRVLSLAPQPLEVEG